MTNKKNSGSAGETLVPAEIEALQAKLQSITHAVNLAQQRTKCIEHLDALKDCRVQHGDIFEESPRDSVQKITLRFEEGGSYEIRNPKLLEEVQQHLIQRFEQRISELEAEIKQASI